jgi:hypothetical protein
MRVGLRAELASGSAIVTLQAVLNMLVALIYLWSDLRNQLMAFPILVGFACVHILRGLDTHAHTHWPLRAMSMLRAHNARCDPAVTATDRRLARCCDASFHPWPIPSPPARLSPHQPHRTSLTTCDMP